MSLPIPKIIFDPQLLGTGWQAPSFDAHRAMILGIFGGAMTARQVEMYAEMTGGLAPRKTRPKTLVIIKSRRVGGTRIAVAISQALALSDWPRAPGERPCTGFAAPDRSQAAIALGYAKGSFAASPLLSHEVTSVTAHRIELANGNAQELGTADDAAMRGYTRPTWTFDEAAYIPNLDALLAAARPALATLPGSMLILVSTPAGADGPVYEMDKRYFGVDDPDTLVIHMHVALFHPALLPLAESEVARDPYRMPAEWFCQFISGLASYIDAPLYDSLVRNEPREIAPFERWADGTPVRVIAAVDISGGRRDRTAIAIVAAYKGRIIVLSVRYWNAPHDAAVVAAQVAEVLKRYGLTTAYADKYGADLSRAIYRAVGVELHDADCSTSDAYMKLLPLLTSGQVEFPPLPLLRREFMGLERRTTGGRDRVDHRPGADSHDDLAAAVAHAVVAAARRDSAGTGEIYVQRSTTLLDSFGASDVVTLWPDGSFTAGGLYE
jgi:hypothetical protein